LQSPPSSQPSEPSPVSEGEERTCVQCRGPVDGKERQVRIDGKTVWLHLECEHFYRKACPSRDLWADYPELHELCRRFQ